MSGVDRSESSHPNCRNEAMEARSREERRGIGGFNRGFRRYPPLLLPTFSTTQSVVPFVPLSPWRRLFVATLFSDTPQLKGIRALTSATQPSRGLVLFAYPASSRCRLPITCHSSPLVFPRGGLPSTNLSFSSPPRNHIYESIRLKKF